MASNLPVPMTAYNGRPLMSLSGEAPRAVYEYVNGTRSDKQRLSEVTGRPLFRFEALCQFTETKAEKVTLLLDTENPLPLMQQVALDYGRSELLIRPEDSYSLAFTITGTLRAEKGGA